MYHLTKANSEIAALKDYRYVVQRYTVSLKQLTVAAYHLQNENKPVFITFRSVEYMQTLTYWERSPFLLADRETCQTLMKQLGLDDTYDLYYVDLPTMRMNIVCGIVKISDTMPDI